VPFDDASNCVVFGCHETCATCNGNSENDCLTCNANAQLLGSAPNACSCKPKFYGSPNAALCFPCDNTCKTCTAEGPNKCETCKTHAELAGAVPNQCICTTGYFASPDASNCSDTGCHTTCLTCDGSAAGDCLTCKILAHLTASPGPSTCECDLGAFENPDAGSCA
jgi:hypothetical protein